MRTVDHASSAAASRWAGLRRDAALLKRLAALVWGYLVPGGRVRRAYRAAERRGEVYWVDAAERGGG